MQLERNADLYECRCLLQQEFAYFVPWADLVASECLNESIHHEPPDKNDDESDSHIEEYFFGARQITTGNTGQIEPPCPREEERGEKDGNVDTGIEDVLSDRCKIAYGLATPDIVATLRNNLVGKNVAGGKHERGSNDEDDEEQQGKSDNLPLGHAASLPWGNLGAVF